MTRTEFRDMTAALYQVVSTPAGSRDWEAVRDYYHPEARVVRTGVDANGDPFAKVMSFDAYVQNVEQTLTDVEFSELELSHEVVFFGNVARLTSVYEFTRRSVGEDRAGRGVNFFTLIYDRERWRIMSIVWDNERPGLSLAAAGLLVAA